MLQVGAAEEGGLDLRTAVVAVLPEAAVHAVQDIGAAGDRADREPAAERLAVGGQVGDDAEVVLRAARMGTQAGEHLVEEQHDAAAPGEFAQRPQELHRAQRGMATLDRLDQHRGDAVAELVDPLQGFRTAVFEDQQFGHGAVRNAGRHRHGGPAVRTRAAQHGVQVAVVRAAEHDDPVASGGGPGEPDGGGVGLGAGGGERDPLQAGQLGELLGDLTGFDRPGAEPQALGEVALDGLGDELRLVSEEEGAEAHGDVGVVVAVQVGQPRAPGRAGRQGVQGLLGGAAEADHGPAVGEHGALALGQLLGPASALGQAAGELGGVRALGGGGGVAGHTGAGRQGHSRAVHGGGRFVGGSGSGSGDGARGRELPLGRRQLRRDLSGECRGPVRRARAHRPRSAVSSATASESWLSMAACVSASTVI